MKTYRRYPFRSAPRSKGARARPLPRSAKIRSAGRDIWNALRGRIEFAHYNDDDVYRAAKYFWRCGLSSVGDLSQSRALNRNFTLEDIRAAGCAALHLACSTSLLHLFPAPTTRSTKKGGAYTERIAPLTLRNFSADLSGLSRLLVPDQAMANDISRHLADGSSCYPAYTPFATENLAGDPWGPKLPTHEKAWGGLERRDAQRPINPTASAPILFILSNLIYLGNSYCGSMGWVWRNFR